jgi:hypothetical protein
MGNFKVRCVRNDSELLKDQCEIGDIFDFKNGSTTWKNGDKSCRYDSVEDFNTRNSEIKFELVTVTEPTFTKADLRTGMRVELRNGRTYVVMLGTYYGDIFINANEFWSNLDNYSNDLKCEGLPKLEIVKVFNPNYTYDMLNANYKGELLYQRTEPTYVTKEEAEAMLSEVEGKEIRIRKE